MSQQNARRISWSITVFSSVIVLIGLILSILALTASGNRATFSHQFFTPLLTITYCVVGSLVASRYPHNLIGWLFCGTGFFSAINMLSSGYALYNELARINDPLPGALFARWLTVWIWIPNVLLPITFSLLLFPDGKLLSTRWRPIAWATELGIFSFIIGMAFHTGPLDVVGLTESNPYGIYGSETLINALMIIAAPLLSVGVFGSIASLFVRFSRAVGIERAQLKGMVAAGVFVVVGNILGGIPWWLWGYNPFTRELSIVVTDITIVTIVVATGIAILRYRLWDIHIFVNRTLVYGSLTALVIGLYIVIVGSLGTLLQTGGNLPVSLFGTGIVAFSFQALRERLQRAVNRLMYGERDDPYALLGRLSKQLEVVTASQSVLPTIVETVANAFKLPYTAITLKEGEQFPIVAEIVCSPALTHANTGREVFPLIYQLETIGQLILAPRAHGESFSTTDRRLLETIARQAGVAAYNVRLTQDLQRSRERLVMTREEERRRLRRDLHDGLGPVLAAMSFKLDAIHNLASQDANTVMKLAAELKMQIQEALGDIRRIAYDLRPPALDELGLVGALKAHVTSHNQLQSLQITLETPENLPLLPAAVEVAAYRITLEAINNVCRHAEAHHCHVRLSLPAERYALHVEILDDGRGLSGAVRAGVGLLSMRERAEELGGKCIAEVLPTGGTGIKARLPLVSTVSTASALAAWTGI